MKVQRQKPNKQQQKHPRILLSAPVWKHILRVYTSRCCTSDGREHPERSSPKGQTAEKRLHVNVTWTGPRFFWSGSSQQNCSVGICGKTNHLPGFTPWILNDLWSACRGAAGFRRRLFQCYFFFLLYCSGSFATSGFCPVLFKPEMSEQNRHSHSPDTLLLLTVFCHEVILFG